jgi:hypothetical protein
MIVYLHPYPGPLRRYDLQNPILVVFKFVLKKVPPDKISKESNILDVKNIPSPV